MMAPRDMRSPMQQAGERVLLALVVGVGGMLMAGSCAAAGVLFLARWLGQ